jgi:uncharacterized protein YndB with AHSA1/START domain
MNETTAVSRALEVTAHVNSTVEEIFSYLTRASLMTHWLCRKAEADPVKGGQYQLWTESDGEGKPDIYGQFVNLVPHKTVQYVWIDERFAVNSLVTIVLGEKLDKVRIDLYHTSLPMDQRYDDPYYAYAGFWKQAFDRLIDHLSA